MVDAVMLWAYQCIIINVYHIYVYTIHAMQFALPCSTASHELVECVEVFGLQLAGQNLQHHRRSCYGGCFSVVQCVYLRQDIIIMIIYLSIYHNNNHQTQSPSCSSHKQRTAERMWEICARRWRHCLHNVVNSMMHP